MPDQTSGPINAVPCPYCTKLLDFADHADESLGGQGWGAALEPGSTADCDHCGRAVRVERIRTVCVVTLSRR